MLFGEKLYIPTRSFSSCIDCIILVIKVYYKRNSESCEIFKNNKKFCLKNFIFLDFLKFD